MQMIHTLARWYPVFRSGLADDDHECRVVCIVDQFYDDGELDDIRCDNMFISDALLVIEQICTGLKYFKNVYTVKPTSVDLEGTLLRALLLSDVPSQLGQSLLHMFTLGFVSRTRLCKSRFLNFILYIATNCQIAHQRSTIEGVVHKPRGQ